MDQCADKLTFERQDSFKRRTEDDEASEVIQDVEACVNIRTLRYHTEVSGTLERI